MYLNIIYFVFAAAALYILAAHKKNKHLIAGVLLTALHGFAALFATNLAGSLIGTHLNINPFSLCISGIFGTAGVIMMLLINSIL